MARKFDLSLLPSKPDLCFETELWTQGTLLVAGIDEAGRGALAGPVSAAAVVLHPDPAVALCLSGVRDSKQMTPHEREYWAERIKTEAQAWSIGFASPVEIDGLGIVPATRLAANRALNCLPISAEHLLIDYLLLADCPLPQTPLVKGDARCLSIAAASVLAKTARDAWLRELDGQYPGYGFAGHKGYATAAHYAALEQLGPCPEHRRSFRLEEREETTRSGWLMADR